LVVGDGREAIDHSRLRTDDFGERVLGLCFFSLESVVKATGSSRRLQTGDGDRHLCFVLVDLDRDLDRNVGFF
jgi:hypothetical protein